MRRILVIKLSALGDIVLALGPFEAIRRHHARDHVTLLTTAPYASLARQSGYFDEIWIDDRPSPFQIGAWLAFRQRLRGAAFDRVYDLQTSDRSAAYFRLFRRRARPEWSGIAAGCSHPHANPRRDFMHTLERQTEQLVTAGLPEPLSPDLSWLDADVTRFGLTPPLALLVPGGAAHRPAKRWPVAGYAGFARWLVEHGITPVLLGTKTERTLFDQIVAAAPRVVDLAGQTDLRDIAGLARQAAGALGNDTGPMHLVAAVSCPCLVLFSGESDPALCRPRGAVVKILRADALSALDLESVEAAWPSRDMERLAMPAGRR